MKEYNNIFRPKDLDEFLGQGEIINKLKVYSKSAKERMVPLDHLLLYGEAGLGKTTIAYALANSMGISIRTISAPSIQNVQDLISIFTIIEKNSILFIDEIHCIDKGIEEMLYSAMEDFKINIAYQTQETTRILNLDVAPFTLIGATTKINKLSKPLRDRFPISMHLRNYTLQEMEKIIRNGLEKMQLKCEDEIYTEIAKRARKTPRIAVNLIKRIYDFCFVSNIKLITKNNCNEVFEFLGIDENGLTIEDYKIFEIMYEKLALIPASLEIIANYFGDSVDSLKNYYEPFLVSEGYILRTKSGRKLTDFGIKSYLLFKNKQKNNKKSENDA